MAWGPVGKICASQETPESNKAAAIAMLSRQDTIVSSAECQMNVGGVFPLTCSIGLSRETSSGDGSAFLNMARFIIRPMGFVLPCISIEG